MNNDREDERGKIGDSGVVSRGTADRGTGTFFASPDKTGRQKPAKQKPASTKPVRSALRDVRLHLYLPMPQSAQDFVEYLDYPWDKSGIGPFTSFGVSLTLLTNEQHGIDEFKKSLSYSGTIVVYMGHTSLIEVKKKTYVAKGLAPQGAKKPVLKNPELVSLLKKAKANLVILAGCSTDSCVPAKLKNDLVVITTASGRDGVTHSAYWARALTGLLLALAGWDFDGRTVTQRTTGTSTIREAMDVGNKFFPKGDAFVLASGDASIREL